MELKEIIASGRYRDCFATDDPGVCIKRLKRVVKKKYYGINVGYPSHWYVKQKFGIGNFNHFEHEVFSSLPDDLKPYIPHRIEMQNDGLVIERIRDSSGQYSLTLKQHGRVADNSFWQHISRIRDIFIQHQMWFLDVFHHGENILVRKNEDTSLSPILIDLKRQGAATYPFQINLLFPGQVEKKFHRRFKEFEEIFGKSQG